MMKNERIDWGLLSAKICESLLNIWRMPLLGLSSFTHKIHKNLLWHRPLNMVSSPDIGMLVTIQYNYSLIGGFKDNANQIASW